MSAKNNVHNGFPSRVGMKIPLIFCIVIQASLTLVPVPANAEDEEWLRMERQMAREQQALDVNEGELQLLDKPPGGVAHHHQNRLMLTEQSLEDGWVTMYQCHSDLDEVSSLQIVYEQERIRDIMVLSVSNIGSAWVEGHTVQLTDIGEKSKVCISADKKALSHQDGRYYLKLGPFMRQFLDGYYPMHVQVEVCYPPLLKLESSRPVQAVTQAREKRLSAEIDVWVVGKLDIELVFIRTGAGGQ
jgi:hypothetical protein